MGNQTSDPALRQLLAKYHHVSRIHSTNFDHATLYRKNTQNYDYLILIQRLLSPPIAQHLQKQLHCLAACKHLHFLKIHYLCVNQEPTAGQPQRQSGVSAVCQQQSREYKCLTACIQYANYTLRDHLAFKQKTLQCITFNEYVYTIKTITQIAIVLTQYDFSCLEFDLEPQHIFITSKGELKIFPLRSKDLYPLKQQCGCFNEIWDEPSSRKPQPRAQVVKLKGVWTKKQKYLKQIKNFAQLMFATALTHNMHSRQSKCYRQAEQHERAQLQDIHLNLVNSISVLEINKLLLGFEDEFFTIGIKDSEHSTLQALTNHNNQPPLPSYTENHEHSITVTSPRSQYPMHKERQQYHLTKINKTQKEIHLNSPFFKSKPKQTNLQAHSFSKKHSLHRF